MNNPTRKNQEAIYRELYTKHKGTPMAVSSESLEHKKIRFKNVCNVFKDDQTDLTVHEVGMGVADMNFYIQNKFVDQEITYSGSEILEEYVAEAKARFPENKFYHRDVAESSFEDSYDYVLISGVFHQRRENTIKEWELFSQNILKNAFKMCKKGISFNFISPFVDFYQTQVYYANLPKLLNFINDDLSRFFEIKHNYALYEFTVHVYKEDYIKSLHPQTEFSKYFKI
ncbi:class I SAM-dependent methyltransferase [Flavicella sediminum]|uniref:class I SAM-dependent methyltransferase n=1 Tax=Flavicella sediminum TaxID=2585141 RepID=UPI001121264D|nr:class I SAM-dependent methyltransferase [Flavicella sediminum]